MVDNFSNGRVTEVTTQGYFSRVGGSIIGMLFGFLLVPASIFLIYWNEGRAVEAATALSAGASQVVEAQPATIDPALNGKLVHLTGPVETTTPARDPEFGITGTGYLRLKRSVEMYQWKEDKSESTHDSIGGTKTTETTYSYERVWSDHAIDSSSFHLGGHSNPSMPVRGATFDSNAAKLGPYGVDRDVLNKVDEFHALTPDAAHPPSGYRVEGETLYRGHDPSDPSVGDIRVKFAAVEAQTVSIVAAQESGTLAPFKGPNDYTIALAKPGSVPAAELFREKQHEENIFTWIFRGVGFVVMVIAFLLIAGPVATVFAFLPFLEGLAETGVFLIALTFAVPVTLLTIAIAWIAHRPLLGGVLLVGAVGSLVLLRQTHKRRPA